MVGSLLPAVHDGGYCGRGVLLMNCSGEGERGDGTVLVSLPFAEERERMGYSASCGYEDSNGIFARLQPFTLIDGEYCVF
jgi:hypothetical protein